MAWYRRGKLALNGFHTLASSVSSQNSILLPSNRILQSGYLNLGNKNASFNGFSSFSSIFQPSSRILQSGYLNLGNKGASFNGFSSFSSISKRLGKMGSENNKNVRVGSQGGNFNGFSSFSSISKRLGKMGFEINKNIGLGCKGGSFNGFSSLSKNFRRLDKKGFEVNKNFRRFYYVDPKNVQHFKPRGPNNWFQNPRHVMIGVVVGSGVFITVYFGNMETVPYTKRTHLILMPKEMEKSLGESEFEKMKAGFKGKILPAMHPESVRVRMIANDIVEALKRGLSKENVWSDIDYASENSVFGEESGKETINALTENEGKVGGNWHREDEVLDDKWVQKSRKKGQERGSQPNTSHLDGLNWEILVVNDPMVNAFCLPGGKIVVFTGLLEHFRSDAEIATIIGHEVGHAVARHSAETMTKSMWVLILNLILYQFVTPDIVNTMSSLFLRLPFSRRLEHIKY
ncbi:M48 family peptidase [Medicago truncatula]|uniref:M48 family peptidase n=1 Tax=Medicago truncatula TaxID=3880 RepID=A0A072UBU5_MEDTR|nr:M48 family peptidase [Medicago truncatula]